MKRQREVSVADRIERVERGDIHQMDQFKSGLVPGMPSCIDDLVLDYVLHDPQNCEKCDKSGKSCQKLSKADMSGASRAKYGKVGQSGAK